MDHLEKLECWAIDRSEEAILKMRQAQLRIAMNLETDEGIKADDFVKLLDVYQANVQVATLWKAYAHLCGTDPVTIPLYNNAMRVISGLEETIVSLSGRK